MPSQRVEPTRRQKRCWRRRLSRARHTSHTFRAASGNAPFPFGDGGAIFEYDGDVDEDGVSYPEREIRSPIVRGRVAWQVFPEEVPPHKAMRRYQRTIKNRMRRRELSEAL